MKVPKSKAPALPLDILKSDCEYAKYPAKPTERDYQRLRIVHNITLYNVTNIGWVVATLHISNSRRPGNAARTYAVDLDGKVWRVGNGPHVLQTVRVQVRQERLQALDKLVQLHLHGAIKANEIRDRISSRRAQGAEHRAAGRHSWMW